MEYPKFKNYDTEYIRSKFMGPNPLKLEEELLNGNKIPDGAVVMDLGSGQGITSVFLANEYNFSKVYAADLWSDPSENRAFFNEMGVSEEKIEPVKADATCLPFCKEYFDAIVSTDSYNYFGRDKNFLNEKLLPYLKQGGYLYVVVPGMKKDLHSSLPKELLLSWTPEQLDYLHDTYYWKDIISAASGIEVHEISEMESNEEVWNDWLALDNEYAVGDRKSMEAGAGKYLNFIAIKIRKI